MSGKTRVEIGTDEISVEVDGVEVAVISEADLRRAGWEFKPECDRDHCDNGDCPGCPYCDQGQMPDQIAVLKRWHDEDSVHGGPFQFCDFEPCKTLGAAVRHG